MTSVDDIAIGQPVASDRGRGMRLGTAVLGPLAVVLALISAVVTFAVLTGLTPIVPTSQVVWGVLGINIATGILLLGIIVREVWKIVQARRRGRAAARLHVQIVGLFSVIAAVPAILVAVVASITIDRTFDRWSRSPRPMCATTWC